MLKINDETVELSAKLSRISEEEIRAINNNLNDIVKEVIDKQIKDKDLALAQYIIKKQNEIIDNIKNYLKKFENDSETGGIDIKYALRILDNEKVE